MTRTERELPTTFVLGDWIVDGDELSVSRGGTSHALEPRAFNVLRYLAERPGHLVSIDELMDVQWKGTVVSPNAVTRVIAQLRKALDDDAKQPQYIATVARTGYRLVAEVHHPKSHGARSLSWGVGGAILVIAALVWFWLPTEPRVPSVAVYPFANFTGDVNLDYIGDGVAEEVINSLAKVSEFIVTARSISFGYPDSGDGPAEFARDLGVEYFVEGSVRRSGEVLRFTAQLIDASDGSHVWSQTSEHEMQELFDGQDDISHDVTIALADEIGIEINQVTARPPLPEAYDLYLRGRQIWHRRGLVPMEPAVNYFSEAVRIDPAFARGWAALASAYVTWSFFSLNGGGVWWDAESVARRALELDPNLAEPYGVIGIVSQARLQWRDAHRLHTEAVARDDRNPTAHYWLSHHLLVVGHVNDSFRHLRKALELDPLYRAPRVSLGWAHLIFGEPNSSLAVFDGLWDERMRSGEPWIGRQLALIATGRLKEARDSLGESPLSDEGTDLHRQFLAIVSGESDDTELVEIFNTIPHPGARHREIMHMLALLERFDEAIGYVRWRVGKGRWVDMSPTWGPGTRLRDQPEFGDALNELGLVEFWDEFGWGDICRRDGSDIVCDSQNVDLTLLDGL